MFGRLLRLMLCTALMSHAAFAAPATKPTVDQVLSFYQTDSYLALTAANVQAALADLNKDASLTSIQIAHINDLIRRIYKKGNLYSVFKEAYVKNTTQENMGTLHNWMITINGIKLRQGYAELYKTQPIDWQAYFDKNSVKVMKANRRNAIDTFITATEQGELYTVNQFGVELAAQLAINATLPKGSRETTSVIKDRLKFKRDLFGKDARPKYLVMDLSLLKALKNQEIDDLSKFSTTAIGQDAARHYRVALEKTLESAANTLVNEIQKGTK